MTATAAMLEATAVQALRSQTATMSSARSATITVIYRYHSRLSVSFMAAAVELQLPSDSCLFVCVVCLSLHVPSRPSNCGSGPATGANDTVHGNPTG